MMTYNPPFTRLSIGRTQTGLLAYHHRAATAGHKASASPIGL
jgi:hypothetical protein